MRSPPTTIMVLYASFIMTCLPKTEQILQRDTRIPEEVRTGPQCANQETCLSEVSVKDHDRTDCKHQCGSLTESQISSSKESNAILSSLTLHLEKLTKILEDACLHPGMGTNTREDSRACATDNNNKAKCENNEVHSKYKYLSWNEIYPQFYKDIGTVLRPLRHVILAESLKRTLANISQQIFKLAENSRAFHRKVETEMTALAQEISTENIRTVPTEKSSVIDQVPKDPIVTVPRSFEPKDFESKTGGTTESKQSQDGGLPQSNQQDFTRKRQPDHTKEHQCMTRDFRYHLLRKQNYVQDERDLHLTLPFLVKMKKRAPPPPGSSVSEKVAETQVQRNNTFIYLAVISVLVLILGWAIVSCWGSDSEEGGSPSTDQVNPSEVDTGSVKTLGILVIYHDPQSEKEVKGMLDRLLQHETKPLVLDVCFYHLTPESSTSGVFHPDLYKADRVIVFVDSRSWKNIQVEGLSRNVGDIAVVLYGDEESKCLPRGSIISGRMVERLSNHHLRGLYRRDRLITVNKGFTNTQTVHLRTLLENDIL